MRYNFLALAESNSPYISQLKEAASRVIDSGRYLCGPETAALEKEVSSYLGAADAVAVSNGLDAIRLILRAYMEKGRLKEGDEVIFPANTYIATLLPVTELGLKAVAVPADPLTHNLDFSRLGKYVSDATRAVITVHLYGSPAWDPEVCQRLHDRGILIIEDNAQAFGAEASSPGFGGSRKCGALGDAAAISFYPTKNLGALGDAGMVVTSDATLAHEVRTLAQYGSDRRYHNIRRGYNNRMDELQAAFLRVKLPHVDAESEKRGKVAEAYCRHISHPDVITPVICSDCRQVWHQFVVRSSRRDELKDWLEANGVGTDIHYPVPPHLQPAYREYFPTDSLREAEELANSVLSLPIANILPEDAKTISSIINELPRLHK